MTDGWFTAEQVFDGKSLRTDVGLHLCDGVVRDIAPAPQAARQLKGLICPGFIDLQVNGGGGVMLNTTPTAAGLATIAAAHRGLGTTHILPTVITDAPEVLDRAADAVLRARDNPSILGLHIEGPHISEVRRGTHAARYVRPMDQRTMEVVARLRTADVPVMITLAPEAATTQQISELTGMGGIVSLGHTDADATLMSSAFAAGARCATHLFNAMSPMLGRAPGAVGSAINSDCYCGIICDGTHVADSMVGMAIRARPVPDRMFLVSDAMATVGGPDAFELYGQRITLKDGRLVNGEGSLAGAHVTQAAAVKRLVDKVGIPLETALRMATSIPAACLGLSDVGRLIGTAAEDAIVLRSDLTLSNSLAATVAAHELDNVGI